MKQQSHLRRGRYSTPGQQYLITTITRQRHPFMADFVIARQVIEAMRHADARGDAHTLAFVVMPDHVHWLLSLENARDLSALVGTMKSRAARLVNARCAPTHRFGWQPGFHDRALRRHENAHAIADYIVANPLRAGLATEIGAYPHWDICPGDIAVCIEGAMPPT